MGIGCRRDPLEANVWYVRAADQDDERAKIRIAAIRAAASGGSTAPLKKGPGSPKREANKKKKKEEAETEKVGNGMAEEKGRTKRWGLF